MNGDRKDKSQNDGLLIGTLSISQLYFACDDPNERSSLRTRVGGFEYEQGKKVCNMSIEIYNYIYILVYINQVTIG